MGRMGKVNRIIHSTAEVDPAARVGGPPESRNWWDNGDGTYKPAVIGMDAKVGFNAKVDGGVERETIVHDRAWVMAGAQIGHDCVIGEKAEIGSGSILCGHVEVGPGARLGVGTVVRPFIKIGAGARTGCGAVVVCDIPPGETWAGNPARRIDGGTNATYLIEPVLGQAIGL